MKRKEIKLDPPREEVHEGHVSYVGRLFECALPHKTIRTRLITLIGKTRKGTAAFETTIFLRDDAALKVPEVGQPIVCKCITKPTGKDGRSVVRDCFEWEPYDKLKVLSAKEVELYKREMRKLGLMFRL